MPGLPARHRDADPRRLQRGWNVRYTTELTEPVWFYLRGEEYSAQIDRFVERGRGPAGPNGLNGFASAAATDSVIAMIARRCRKAASTRIDGEATVPDRNRSPSFLPGSGVSRPMSSDGVEPAG